MSNMSNNPVVEAYNFASAIESISVDPAIRVIAEISPAVIKESSKNAVNVLVEHGHSSRELTQNAIRAEHDILFGNPNNRAKAQQDYLAAKAASAKGSEEEDIAWDDYSRISVVKMQQQRLSRRFIAVMALSGALIGGAGMGLLTARAQVSVAKNLNAQDRAEHLHLPQLSTSPDIPSDSLAGVIGALGLGEAALLTGYVLSPRAAHLRAKRIVRNADTI